MENNLERYCKPGSDDTQDGMATPQHDMCIFRNFGDLLQFWWKKKLFWGVYRWEKDALVIDSADYNMVWSL